MVGLLWRWSDSAKRISTRNRVRGWVVPAEGSSAILSCHTAETPL